MPNHDGAEDKAKPEGSAFTHADELTASMDDNNPYPNRIDDPDLARAVAEDTKDIEVEIAGHERTIKDSPEWSIGTAEADIKIQSLRKEANFAEELVRGVYKHPELKDEFGHPLDVDSLVGLMQNIRVVRLMAIEAQDSIDGGPDFPADVAMDMTKRSGRFDALDIDTSKVDEIGETLGVDSKEYREAANVLFRKLLQRYQEQDQELTRLIQPILEESPELVESMQVD